MCLETFYQGEAKNEEVCCNEENDQSKRSKIVSVLHLISQFIFFLKNYVLKQS